MGVGGTGVAVGGADVGVGGAGVAVGGTGVAVGGTGVAVGGTGVGVGGTGVTVGGTGVAVGGTGVAVGGTGVGVGGTDVAVGGTGVGVGGTDVAVGETARATETSTSYLCEASYIMSAKVTNTTQPTRTLTLSTLRKNEFIQDLWGKFADFASAIPLYLMERRFRVHQGVRQSILKNARACQRSSCKVMGVKLGSMIYTSP